jgi:endo-1,4-beta-xylanase
MGDDYIAKCFQFAHEADPNCKLFYNDYSLEKNESKQQKVFELIADWQRRKIPIQGIGFQMHVGYLISKNQIQTVTNRAVGTGLLIHYSELDMRMNPSNDITKFTQERALAQQEKYKEIVQIYNAIPVANKFGITLWGLKDDDSWLLKHHKNNNEWPLLFDSNFKPKKAYTGFLEGLQ